MAGANQDQQAIEIGSSNVPWYISTLKTVPGPFEKLLEDYSGISPEEVKGHVHEVVGLPFLLFAR